MVNIEQGEHYKFTYRSAATEDAESIQLVTERAIAARKGHSIPITVCRPEYISQHEKQLSKDSTWSRLVFDGRRLIGLAIGEPSEKSDNQQHLTLLMVDPEYWGNGIGGSLLDQLEQEMKHQSVNSIEVWTGVNNQRSQELYRRKGFAPTGLHSNLHGEQAQFVKIIE